MHPRGQNAHVLRSERDCSLKSVTRGLSIEAEYEAANRVRQVSLSQIRPEDDGSSSGIHGARRNESRLRQAVIRSEGKAFRQGRVSLGEVRVEVYGVLKSGNS